MMKKLLCSLLFTVLAVGFVQAQYGNVSGGGPPLMVITTTPTAVTTNTPNITDGTDLGTTTVGTPLSQTFTFTSNSASQLLVGLGAITGTDAAEFSVGIANPSNITGVGTFSTFTVDFTPTSSGTKSAIIEVKVNNFPPPLVTESYFFEITAEAGAAAPSIKIFGDDDIEIPNPLFGPSITDNTHYGDVVANSDSRTRTFTISNEDGNADLIITEINGLLTQSDFVFDLGALSLPITVPAGFTFDLDIIFTPTSVNSINEFVEIKTNDVDFYFEVLGVGIAATPNMEVFGNSTLISSGDITPTTADHTVFPDVDIALGGVTRTFTIENNGTSDVVLTSLSPIVNITGADAADFTVTTNPTTPIIAGGSTTFVITFDPTIEGTKDATVEISNNGVDNPYIFDIQGTATETVVSDNPLMITQYYEGLSTTNKWVEVKNISSETVINGSYNLAVFLDDRATNSAIDNITNTAPNFAVAIPTLDAGEIALFYKGTALPPNIGAYDVLVDNTEVCEFTGNDVIVISPSTSATCYSERIDIMGVVGATTTDWGSNKSLVKGCGTTLQPAIVYDPTNIDYDPAQFIELTLAEVDNADATMDIALGTQSFGTTTFTTAWSDGVPDRTREAIVAGAYTNSNGSISACNLTINSGASVIMDSDGAGNNYVLVTDALVNNGTFTLGDTESLTITKATGTVSGILSKIEKTTTLNNFRDLTYWSAPVSTTIESAFAGVDPNRIWLWTTPFNDDTGNWAVASGSMDEGRGYVAEAPSTITTGQQHEVTFTGVPNNGPINVTVGVDLTGPFAPYNGYNIIGNPYPSAIDIDIFLRNQDNDEINDGDDVFTDATVWLWTHGTPISGGLVGEYSPADYATYNLVGGVQTSDPNGASPEPTNIIGSGQGFLIRALSNGSVGFNNGMRVTGQNDTQFYKSQKNVTTEKDRIWLNFKSNDGVLFNQTLIGFMEEATDGYDIGYDGLKLDGGAGLSFYSNLEDDVYAIQGFGPFNPSTEVSLGVYAAKAAMHTISIHKMEGVLVDEDIYLLDNELNIVHDLRQGDYEFEIIDAGNYKDRFTLKFNSGVLSTDDVVLNNSFIVYNQDGTLKIKAGVEISKLKVYDVMGRLLIDSEPKSTAFDVPAQNIKAGTVLILNATMKDGSSISKKAIKY